MRTLLIFVKRPVPGRVKTRLAASLGDERAARLYEAFTRDLVERFRGVADRGVLFHDPDDEPTRAYVENLAQSSYECWPQPDDALGGRLVHGFRRSFDASERAVAIGSDSPLLPRSFVERAFEQLAGSDSVLGPATDGGYCLVGLRRTPKLAPEEIFRDIEWSRSRVLAQTVERVSGAGGTLSLLPPWYDVDTGDDLDFLIGHVAALRAAGEDVDLPATEALLAELRSEQSEN